MSDVLLQIPGVWRASTVKPSQGVIATGSVALDQALGGGWPAAGLVEFLCDSQGIGELSLLLPLLRQIEHRAAPPQPVLWVSPPHQLQAVALRQQGMEPARHWVVQPPHRRDALWAIEQALRMEACALVVAWLPQVDWASLRRIKLAALASSTLCLIFRGEKAAAEASPAQVRAVLWEYQQRLQVRLLKLSAGLPTLVSVDLSSRIKYRAEATVVMNKAAGTSPPVCDESAEVFSGI